ncbi:hypothetical protein SG09_35400 [Bradyrhizobium ottawaense]|nr:hypothetical protein SG09_35400 [Bradyrhizobium ottawaense]GMO46141.1 hypothetical protein BwSF21_62260 [Bradyrhizobium ottawaense]
MFQHFGGNKNIKSPPTDSIRPAGLTEIDFLHLGNACRNIDLPADPHQLAKTEFHKAPQQFSLAATNIGDARRTVRRYQ